MSSINYIVSILKDAGFTKAQLKPATPSHVNKLFADYLNSCEWSEEWFFAIDPSQLDGEQLKLYDSAKELYDTPSTEDIMFELGVQAVMSYEQLDMLGVENLSSQEVDEILNTIHSIEPITVDVEPVLIHDVKLDELSVEPEPVEVIVPQEVISEPQEELSLSTTTEDKTMSIILPDFSTNGNTFTLVPVEFTSIWYEVPVDVVELNGQYTEFTCHISDGWTGECSDVLEGWVGKVSHLTSHISDGWYGQCCLLTDAPKVEPEPELSEAEARVARACAKMARSSAYGSPVRYGTPTPTTTTKSGKVVQVSPHALQPHGNAPIANRITSPKVTPAIGEAEAFKSTLFNVDAFDVVKQATQALLDMFSPDEYNTLRDKYGVDVMKKAFNTLQGDIRTRIRSMINEANTIRNGIELTVVATQAPSIKPSTATFAPNFNSSVIAKYTALNGGVIRDSLILNKLTSALRANNIEAYNKYVTTFNNPTAVALHRQAYDAVVSAS